MKKSLLFGVVAFALFISGCSRYDTAYRNSHDMYWNYSSNYKDQRPTNIFHVSSIGQATFFTTRELTNLSKLKDVKNKTIAITSLVGINNLQKTSDFGRLYSESMLSDFVRAGWKIIDYRGTKILTESKNGEFYLNRNNLKNLPSDSIIFVGTYGQYQNGLILNLRLLNVKDNTVVAASSVLLKGFKKSSPPLKKIKPCVRAPGSDDCFSMKVE